MSRHTHALSIERKRELVEDARTNGATLDGEPASVSGSGLPFASVRLKSGRGGTVEFAWATVERILSSHRNFQS